MRSMPLPGGPWHSACFPLLEIHISLGGLPGEIGSILSISYVPLSLQGVISENRSKSNHVPLSEPSPTPTPKNKKEATLI